MTTHDPLVARVLGRIKSEGLHPRPRWAFIFENWFFWGLGALAVLLGAIAFSAAAFEVENAGWDLYLATHGDWLTFFLASAPFLWVGALAAFIAIGYVNIRRTRRGYRYSLTVIALGAVLTSVSLGSALYGLGVGELAEQALGDHPPFYRPILEKERGWWRAPEAGLLGGTVVSSTPDFSTFTVKDFDGEAWQVDGTDLDHHDQVIVARGGTVRLVGVATTSTSGAVVFHACFAFAGGALAGRIPAPPLATVASTSVGAPPVPATSAPPARSEICTGLRPYDKLRALDDDGPAP